MKQTVRERVERAICVIDLEAPPAWRFRDTQYHVSLVPTETIADRIAAAAPSFEVTPRRFFDVLDESESLKHCQLRIDEGLDCPCIPFIAFDIDLELEHHEVEWDPEVRL